MVERVEHDGLAAERDLLLLAVDARDADVATGEQPGSDVAERRHDGRPDQLDLAEEVRLAGRDLLGQGSRFCGGRHLSRFAT